MNLLTKDGGVDSSEGPVTQKSLYGSVGFSTASDITEVLRFYDENQHEHVDARDPAELEQEATDGRLLLIRKEGDIVAASSAFNYSVEKGAPPSWVEIGATRVALNGYGFYPFIIASQSLEEVIRGTPEDYLFANIYADNEAVKHLLGVKTGWDNFLVSDDPTLEATYSRKKNVTPEEMNTWAWLRSPAGRLPHQARIVRDVVREQHFMNVKQPDTPVRLNLDLSSFSLAEPSRARKIEMLAEGPFSEFLERHGDKISCKDVSRALEDGDTQALMSQFEM